MIAFAGFAGYQGISSLAGGLNSFSHPAPSTHVAEADEDLAIYVSGTAVPEGLEVTVVGPSQQEIATEATTVDVEINLGAETSQLARTFQAGEAGSYIVSATLPEGETATLSIGPGVGTLGGTGAAVLAGVCLGIPFSIAGIVCLIIGLVRRFSS